MANENRILSNINYSIHNYSNYDITTEETRDIIDVPYFPAQNLVDVSKTISVYNPLPNYTLCYIPFVDEINGDRLFAVIYRPDARYTFVEFGDNARYHHYVFTGNSYPQGRTTKLSDSDDKYAEETGGESYSFDGQRLYIFGGYCNGRCTDDLWEYDLQKNTWKNINYSSEEKNTNEAPAKRRKASILKLQSEIWLFGGETDLLTINSMEEEFFVTLNDIWKLDLNTGVWKNYDTNRTLPHRAGHVVYVDSTKVRIYIDSGLNDIGILEPSGIWTVDLITDAVTFNAYNAPFTPSHMNICIQIDGIVHILSGSDLYKWNEEDQEFVLVKSGITTINPQTKNYWKLRVNEKYFGQQSTMGSMEVAEPELYDWNDTLIDIKTIELPPRGRHIPRINIDNVMTFWYGGLIDKDHFNESTYIMNHITREVEKYDFPSDQRPTERVFPSLAYDRYRGRIWLFGGFDGSKHYNDLWYFDLGTKEWHKVHGQLENTDVENPVYPQPRQKAGMAVVADGQYLYIIGGYSDVHAFNDFWMYNIDTNEWKEVYTTDNIPWGSEYFIYEWKDRLWLYNGQKLYRYFYQNKQFVEQPLFFPSPAGLKDTTKEDSIDPNNPEEDPLALYIVQKKYLETPINAILVNDRLFIRNPAFHFYIDMETREVRNIGRIWDIKEDVIWLDRYYGEGIIEKEGQNIVDFYINVSPMFSLTKNQVPSSWDSGPVNMVDRDGVFCIDALAETGENKFTYLDRAGTFKIKKDVWELDKVNLLMKGDISIVGVPGEVNVDFNNPDAVYQATLDALLQPHAYLYGPWFSYSKYKPLGYKYTGARRVIYNPRNRRIYIIYRNGNVVKINPVDGTFFVYFTKLWAGSSIGYYEGGNKLYAFGGLRNERAVYTQNGVRSYPIESEEIEEYSHSGLLEFDLNMNEMNLGSVENMLREKKMKMIDYTLTRDYLYNKIKNYIEGYVNNTVPQTIEEVKYKIYTSMQPLVDDLSQFDFVFEGGSRPLGRAYAASVQIGNKLYIFGGCDVYNKKCKPNSTRILDEPYYTNKIGFLMNQMGHEVDVDAESKRCYYFDMSTKTWHEIASMPEWRYLASAISSPDNRYIYVIGGYAGADCSEIRNTILRYDRQNDIWSEIKGIPNTFAPRAMPILEWLDEYHLMISYGFRSKLYILEGDGSCLYGVWIHFPISDGWIYDTRNNLLYKGWEDKILPLGLVVKDSFYIDEPKENCIYIIPMTPQKDDREYNIVKLYKWDLVKGDTTVMKIIPTTEIMEDWNGLSLSEDAVGKYLAEKIQSTIGEGKSPDDIMEKSMYLTSSALISQMAEMSNFRFRYAWIQEYGPYKHKYLFIIGERAEKAGIEWIDEMAHGHTSAHLRIWYVDLDLPEVNRYMYNIPYEYPLPISPVAIAYDGSQYLYVIYNKYNIWKLDFKNMMTDPNGSWWSQLPPCINCNFLGDDRMDPKWDTFFIPPKYLTLVSSEGMFARMDTETYVWFLDKRRPPSPPVDDVKLVVASGVDGNEIYMYRHGGISGKVMNVFERQWDNFFFDMSVVADVDRLYSSLIDQKMWPTVLRRRRLYTVNHIGHIYYAWLRIDGQFDVEYQLQDFYRVDEVRIYGDDEYIQNWNNTRVQVFHVAYGWVEIEQAHMEIIINETGWEWDPQYDRRYKRQFYSPAIGEVITQVSKCPPNYLKVDLVSKFGEGGAPVSKVRIFYKNTPQPYNYLSRINRVEAITYQTEVAAYDSPTAVNPVEIIHIEPLTVDEVYSNAFGVTVKNTGDDTARDIITYVYNNKWLQFSLNPSDPESWTIRDQNNPFYLVEELNPGDTFIFYVRAINIDMRPHVTDLVVKGVYSYKG